MSNFDAYTLRKILNLQREKEGTTQLFGYCASEY